MTKEETFVSIIKQHEGIIYKIASLYSDTKVEQQDLYQDIVYQLYKAFDSFRQEAKVSTWLYRVALNTALGGLRKKKNRPQGTPLQPWHLEPAEPYDFSYEERLTQLYQHMASLNALDKGLIILLLEGKKYEEIAIITGLSTSNVGTRISRIKEKLKSQIVKEK